MSAVLHERIKSSRLGTLETQLTLNGAGVSAASAIPLFSEANTIGAVALGNWAAALTLFGLSLAMGSVGIVLQKYSRRRWALERMRDVNYILWTIKQIA